MAGVAVALALLAGPRDLPDRRPRHLLRRLGDRVDGLGRRLLGRRPGAVRRPRQQAAARVHAPRPLRGLRLRGPDGPPGARRPPGRRDDRRLLPRPPGAGVPPGGRGPDRAARPALPLGLGRPALADRGRSTTSRCCSSSPACWWRCAGSASRGRRASRSTWRHRPFYAASVLVYESTTGRRPFRLADLRLAGGLAPRGPARRDGRLRRRRRRDLVLGAHLQVHRALRRPDRAHPRHPARGDRPGRGVPAAGRPTRPPIRWCSRSWSLGVAHRRRRGRGKAEPRGAPLGGGRGRLRRRPRALLGDLRAAGLLHADLRGDRGPRQRRRHLPGGDPGLGGAAGSGHPRPPQRRRARRRRGRADPGRLRRRSTSASSATGRARGRCSRTSSPRSRRRTPARTTSSSSSASPARPAPTSRRSTSPTTSGRRPRSAPTPSVATYPVFDGAELACTPKGVQVDRLPTPLYWFINLNDRDTPKLTEYGGATFVDVAAGRSESIGSREACEAALERVRTGRVPGVATRLGISPRYSGPCCSERNTSSATGPPTARRATSGRRAAPSPCSPPRAERAARSAPRP